MTAGSKAECEVLTDRNVVEKTPRRRVLVSLYAAMFCNRFVRIPGWVQGVAFPIYLAPDVHTHRRIAVTFGYICRQFYRASTQGINNFRDVVWM